MKNLIAFGLLAISVVTGNALAATPNDLEGRWEVTVLNGHDPGYARLTVSVENGHFNAMLGPQSLNPYSAPLKFDGSPDGTGVRFACTSPANIVGSCGELDLRVERGGLVGAATMFGIKYTITGTRPAVRSANAPTQYDFEPQFFQHRFSATEPPVLRIFPGDTVHTNTVDAAGVDRYGVPRSKAYSNTLTGPFYIEGAMPGDTIAIHFKRIRVNRPTASMWNKTIAGSALNPYYFRDEKAADNFDTTWKLDSTRGTATLANPSEKLKKFVVQLHPILGCVGVAPPAGQSIITGELGDYGGNLDDPDLREGTTLFLPVFQRGALLYIGDAHAEQGFGELTGQGMETSMEVEFSIDVIEGKSLGQPSAEDDEYVMVSGISTSMADALRSATTGMAKWLSDTYHLNPTEVAMVMSTSMNYDIAEVVDPQIHIVAKIRKDVLNQIPEQ